MELDKLYPRKRTTQITGLALGTTLVLLAKELAFVEGEKLRCEVILLQNEMRGEITEYHFTKLCLNMNRPLILTTIFQFEWLKVDQMANSSDFEPPIKIPTIQMEIAVILELAFKIGTSKSSVF